MPKLWIDTPRFTDGVSQQPDSRRFRSQAAEAVNASMWIIEGLDKRNGTDHVAEILNTDVAETYWAHWIDRGDDERYMILGQQPLSTGISRMRAFNSNTGAEIHVEDSASAAAGGTLGGTAPTYDYLGGLTTPREEVRLLTVADNTFVLNKSQTTAMDTAFKTTSVANGEAFIFVRIGNYEIDYDISIEENTGTPLVTSVNAHTWDGITATAGEVASLNTGDIAEDLRTKIDAITGITATRVGSVIKVAGSSGHELINIEASDGVGDTSIEVLYEQVDSFVDLPLVCEDGFKLRVTGDPNIGGDDYFIEFAANKSGAFGNGVWEQSIAHDTEFQFDDDTMPHRLLRQVSDGSALPSGYTPSNGEVYFEFAKIPWGERVTGDSTLVPDPSFVGESMENVFLHKNRLGFLADNNVILSEVNGFFNFWRTDLANLLDSDTIDVTISHPQVALGKWAESNQDDLIIFSDRAEFRMAGSDTLTPKTAGISLVSSVRADEQARPIPMDTGLAFAQENSQFSRVFELFRRGDSELYDSADLTEQVPRYLPGRVRELTRSTESNTMAAVMADPDADNQGTLFMYSWHWNGNRRVQSAWHKWDFGVDADVRSAYFYQDLLHILVTRGDNVYLETLDTSTGGVDLNQNFRVKMDRKWPITTGVTYDINENVSTINLPYDLTTNEVPQVLTWSTTGVGVPTDAKVLVVEANRDVPGSHYLEVLGDHTSPSTLWVGTQFTMEYTMSSLLAKEPTETGEKAILMGPEQVFQGLINFEDSGPFRVEVAPANQDSYTYKFTGRGLNTPTSGSFAGTQPMDGGELNFPVLGSAREVVVKIINDEPYPSKIQRAEWLVNHRIGFGRFNR